MTQLTPIEPTALPDPDGLASNHPTPSELLDHGLDDGSALDTHLWGFGGLHGGLALALTADRMSRVADGELRSITGQFLRPTRHSAGIRTEPVRLGRSVQVVSATLHSGAKPSVHATATFGRSLRHEIEPIGPPPEAAGDPFDHEVFTPPIDFVPIMRFIEVRPVGQSRPFAGGDRAELMAWIRLIDDDTPIGCSRMIMLADSLAPSYSAILDDLAVVPTIELTVRPGAGLASASSPWALIRAESATASSDGWINERIDMWSPAGGHLGSAHQLRVIASHS